MIPDFQSLDLDSQALQSAKAGLPLSSQDLWGLQCALSHSLADDYLEKNREWGVTMLDRIMAYRNDHCPDTHWEKADEVHAVHDPTTQITTIE